MKVRIVKNRQTGSQTLTVTATRGETLDYAHAQWLSAGRLAMLAFRYEANDRETLCHYDATGATSLQDAARAGMADAVYVGALLSATAVLEECESQGLAVVCVLWEPKHVFVGPDGGVRFAFVPLFGADAGRRNTVHTLLTFLADARRVRLQSPNAAALQQSLGGFLMQNPTVSAARLNGFLASMGLISAPTDGGGASATSAEATQASPTVAGATRAVSIDNDPFGATVIGSRGVAGAGAGAGAGSSVGAGAGGATASANLLHQLHGVSDLTGGTGSGFTGTGYTGSGFTGSGMTTGSGLSATDGTTGTGSGFTGSTGPTESFGPRPVAQQPTVPSQPAPQSVQSQYAGQHVNQSRPIVASHGISDETVASTLPRPAAAGISDETVASTLPRATASGISGETVASALPYPVVTGISDETVASTLPRRTAPETQPVVARPLATSSTPVPGTASGRTDGQSDSSGSTNPSHTEPVTRQTGNTVPQSQPQPQREPARDFAAVLNGDKPRPKPAMPAYRAPSIRTNPAARPEPQSDADDSEGATRMFGATEHSGFEVTRLRDGRTLNATGAIARKATIGRSKTADLHMGGNSNVSRVHATIEVMDDGRFAITDNDSANGTSVRGREMARGGTEYLSSGEDFALADDTFIIRAL